MRYELRHGHTYRAEIVLDPFVRTVISAEMLANELQQYHLFGQVTENTKGYIVQAEFRGRSGQYELPEAVQTVELIS